MDDESCSFVTIMQLITTYTLFFIDKNMFYRNIKAEILRRIDVILCVETSANTIQPVL